MFRLPEVFSRRIRRVFELTRLASLAWQVSRHSFATLGHPPVVFFNSSTRLSGLSQNAAFSLLTSWLLRLGGTPVIHFVCKAGMSACLLGSNEIDPSQPMPCGMCVRQSRVNYAWAEAHWFEYQQDGSLASALRDLSLDELLSYEHPLPAGWIFARPNTDPLNPAADPPISIPLGALVLPSLRWRPGVQRISWNRQPTQKDKTP